jgi:signal transduction histidine kinase
MLERLLLFLYIFSTCAVTATAQTEYPAIGHITLSDTSNIRSALQLARSLTSTHPDSAYGILANTLSRSEQLQYSFGQGLSWLYKGIIETNRPQLDQAEQSFRKAIRAFEQTAAGRRQLHRAYSNLGNVAFLRGAYDQSLRLQLQAIELGEKYPGDDINYLYSNVAAVLMQTGRGAATVMPYIKKAEAAALKDNNYPALSRIYNNAGLALSLDRLWDSSLVYFHKALKVAREQQVRDMEQMALSNTGIILLQQKKPDSAVNYLEQAVAMDSLATAYTRNRTRAALGMSYLQLHRIAEARPLLKAQFAAAQQSGNLQDLREAYYGMSLLSGKEGKFEEGYRHAWNYIHANDSIAGYEVINNINNLEVKYKTSEKEKKIIQNQLRIAKQERELQRRNNLLILAAAAAVLLGLILLLLRTTQRNRKRILLQRIRNMEQENAIEKLQATIAGEESERSRIARELHDGLSAMVAAAKMNLAVLGRESDTAMRSEVYQNTLDLLDEVGTELRLTAHNMMPTAIAAHSLDEAIANFCNYAAKGKNINIDFQAYGDFGQLPDNYRLTVYRIIQELVNNVVKHAKASSALVQLMLQDGILSVTVEDNGKGMNENTASEGMGMQSIHDRVKSLQGQISFNARTNKGTSVYIEFDLNEGKAAGNT